MAPAPEKPLPTAPEGRLLGRAGGPLAALLLLTAVWAVVHLWRIGAEALIYEEGRRVWPAMEILGGGHAWLPSIWGRPYLAKPPLYFVTVAGFLRAGAGPELAVRLPAALATLATAWTLLGLGAAAGARPAGARWSAAGWVAGASWLLSQSAFGKGSLGELEAPLTLALLTALACTWRARDGGWSWTGLAAVALTAAAFVKGPPAFLVFGAGLLVLLHGHAPARRRLGLQAWLPLLLAAGAFLGWALWVRAQPEVRDALATWQREVVGRGARTLSGWASERASLVAGVLLGWAPATLLLFLVRGSRRARGSRGEERPHSSASAARTLDLETFAFRTAVVGVALLMLTPGVRVRYAHPLAPWCALAAGLAVARVAAGPAGALRDRLRQAGWVGLGLLALTVVGGVGLAAGWIPSEGVDRPAAAALVVLAAGAGVRAWRTRRDGPGPALATLFLGCFLVQLAVAQVASPGRTDKRGHRTTGAELARVVPAGETLHTTVWEFFNELAYLERPVRWLEDPAAAPAGTLVLVEAARLPDLDARRGTPAEVLLRYTFIPERETAVVRLR